MRISGGKARGVQLSVSKKSVHRPAMDRLRQGIFSSLGQIVVDASVCDLYAGTGSYGLEALSRGSSSCCFVELSRMDCNTIRNNLRIVGKSMGEPALIAKVIQGDAVKTISQITENYDIIFVDPPYDTITHSAQKLFDAFDHALSNNGLVVFEMPGNLEIIPKGWILKKRLGKGNNQPTACLYKRA
tara:strand:- start:663 stop:1220 length:558 start_codon:yes stop_codon:yes gene_type:complete